MSINLGEACISLWFTSPWFFHHDLFQHVFLAILAGNTEFQNGGLIKSIGQIRNFGLCIYTLPFKTSFEKTSEDLSIRL